MRWGNMGLMLGGGSFIGKVLGGTSVAGEGEGKRRGVVG